MNYKLKPNFFLYIHIWSSTDNFSIVLSFIKHKWVMIVSEFNSHKKREKNTIENYKHDEKPFDKCYLRALSLIILSTNINKNYEMSSSVWFLCGKKFHELCVLISTTIFFCSYINCIYFSVDFSRYLFECWLNTFQFIWICYSPICKKKNHNWCLIVTVFWW